jgi:hypothetical protein
VTPFYGTNVSSTEATRNEGYGEQLVQYYLGTKEALLLFATQQLAAQYAARVMPRINGLKEADGQARPRAAGDMPARLDLDLEAVILITMSAGLGASVLAGHSSPGQGQEVIEYHLSRLFPAYQPA